MDTGIQKTIKKDVTFSGKALQSGVDVKVTIKPAAADSGIIFKRTDLSGNIPIRLSDGIFTDAFSRRTTIGHGEAHVQTVEHLMAALWALGIDNVMIEVDNVELPALDGSAKLYFNGLNEAGTDEQGSPRTKIKITEKETVSGGNSSISAYPDEVFSVSYRIDYPVKSIGENVFKVSPDTAIFGTEIAPARTFCLKQEAEALLKAGLGRGATSDNTLVLDKTGPVGTSLRFKDEPVRHKVLDLIGDLYLLGKPIIGRIEADRSGHSLNLKMVKILYEKYIRRSK